MNVSTPFSVQRWRATVAAATSSARFSASRRPLVEVDAGRSLERFRAISSAAVVRDRDRPCADAQALGGGAATQVYVVAMELEARVEAHALLGEHCSFHAEKDAVEQRAGHRRRAVDADARAG